MLGMYVHTHWGYNHPYAARTWTIADWRDPGVRHGIVPRLLDAVESWCS